MTSTGFVLGLAQSGKTEASSMVAAVMLFFLGAALYFLPSILAWNKRNLGAILALNFLLGWTVIGWIVALIWALTNDRETTQVRFQQTTAPPPAPASILCSGCGRYSQSGAKFCSGCGQRLHAPNRTLSPNFKSTSEVSNSLGAVKTASKPKDRPLTKVAAWAVGGFLLLVVLGRLVGMLSNPNHQESTRSAAPASISQLADPVTWAIKPKANRDANGGIVVYAETNIPEGVNLWIQLTNGATAKTRVSGGRMLSEPFTNKGKPIESGQHRLTFVAHFNEAWEQPAAVLALTGHDGRNLKGTLFHKTDPDVIDSAKFLEYRTTINFPSMSRELDAVSLVKSSVLIVDGKRSSATIGETVNWFLQPSTGIKIRKGWGAIPKGSDVYEVQLDIVDAANDGPAIWEADLRSKRVKYINSAAKYMSYLPPD